MPHLAMVIMMSGDDPPCEPGRLAVNAWNDGRQRLVVHAWDMWVMRILEHCLEILVGSHVGESLGDR